MLVNNEKERTADTRPTRSHARQEPAERPTRPISVLGLLKQAKLICGGKKIRTMAARDLGVRIHGMSGSCPE